MVKTIWFRAYLERSEDGRRALGTVAALFDGLLPDAKGAERVKRLASGLLHLSACPYDEVSRDEAPLRTPTVRT